MCDMLRVSLNVTLQLKRFLRKMMTLRSVAMKELARLLCQSLYLILSRLQEVLSLLLLHQCGHKTYSIDLVIRCVSWL